MESSDQINKTLRALQPDIRLEVILADLLDAGWSFEDFELVSNSLFHRNYHRDIEQPETTDPSAGAASRLRFVINRQGIYDQLPEDLFHQTGTLTTGTDKSASLQELRDQAKTETQSRRFFLPLEQEFYRQRVRLEQEERKFLFDTTDHLPTDVFDLLWDLPEIPDERQRSRLGLLIPLLHSISGDMGRMEAALEWISGEPVTICRTAPRTTMLRTNAILGETALGKTMVLGGRLSSMQPGYRVIVRLGENQDLSEWLDGGKKKSLFEFFCSFLIPFDADLSVLVVPQHGSEFKLAEEENHQARLNFTTTI